MNILKTGKLRHSKDVPIEAQQIYRVAQNIRKTAKRLDRELATTKRRLKEAQNVLLSEDFLKLKLNETSAIFFMGQLKNQAISPKGRRYTLADKTFALAVMKQSPKGYKFLQLIFALPSRKTLLNLLHKVPFKAGVNVHIFDHLKLTAEKMDPRNRYCIIIFDEIALEPSIQYNTGADSFDGFQDNGTESTKVPIIADKGMVFMARGIFKKWKQPLSFYFNKGGMKSDMIAHTLKTNIIAAQSAGLEVIGTVCDQGAPNRSAINLLYSETNRIFKSRDQENRLFGFLVNDKEIVPLYDPPHLLKCMRNLLFDHDIEYEIKGKTMTAKWEHIANLVSLDQVEEDTDYRMLHKITNLHIQNRKKMKVAYAAQIFSKRVASLLRGLARLSPHNIPTNATETAELVLFMDKCFDSVNGSKYVQENRLRCAVSKDSPHFDFWLEALKVFESMRCLRSNGSKYKPPTIHNWVHTLKGFRYLWKKFQKEGVTYLSCRNINQDPLENFFGAIRSHGIRNINPTCQSFTYSFRTLLLNNLTSVHSPSANCEKDDSSVLDSFKSLISVPQQTSDVHFEVPDVNLSSELSDQSLQRTATSTYVAGSVVRSIIKQINNCVLCKKQLVGSLNELSLKERFIIQEYQIENRRPLTTPSIMFNTLFQTAIHILTEILPQAKYKMRFKGNLKTKFKFHLHMSGT
uniref:THAP-type domain-containing protein n=1 Tax=Photinus pyralis TaxID=7054 RepID=A0A1Y1NHP2_PHOPY